MYNSNVSIFAKKQNNTTQKILKQPKPTLATTKKTKQKKTKKKQKTSNFFIDKIY